MTKVIVIGGGIAGCSTAYALAERGFKVTLIERNDTLAQEASGNPSAMLYPKLSTKPSAPSTLGLHGFMYTLMLLNKLAIKRKCFEICGLLQLAFNAREQARQFELSKQKDLSQYFQALDAKAASELAGIELSVGGLYLPQAGWLNPVAFCETLTSSSLITKMTSTEALQVERMQGRWRVADTKNNSYEADDVVLCNANDIQQFSQCKSLNVTPVRGQVNFFNENTASQSLKTIICTDHYLSPAIDGFHSIGTSYAPNDDNPDLSESDMRDNLLALRKISPLLFESMMQAPSIKGRVAWRSATPDYIPLAGELIDDVAIRQNPPRYNAKPESLPWLKGLYVNAGHGSKGMITAPICGELIARLVNNETLNIDALLASKLNPSRFLLRELGLKQLAQSLY